jgi:hypothetical protein
LDLIDFRNTYLQPADWANAIRHANKEIKFDFLLPEYTVIFPLPCKDYAFAEFLALKT